MRIITGMHRSGTSLIARLFYEAGADMGEPENFYPPDRWNPEGYFEQPEIHAINMPLINGPWWKFAYFFLPSTNTILKRAKKRANQITETAAQYDNKVVKETRFCLTLPAWLRYGAQIERILVCLRDPIQVARSIQKRNFTTIRHGLKLWYIHNKRILENSKGIPLRFIYYNNMLDRVSFMREVQFAFRFFDHSITGEQLLHLYGKCVKPKMNHNSEKTASYPPKITALWQELITYHHNQFKEKSNL